MKSKLGIVLLLSLLLVSCKSKEEVKTPEVDPYTYPEYVDTKGQVGEIPVKLEEGKYIPYSTDDNLESIDEEEETISEDGIENEETISSNVKHNTILPEGLEFRDNIIYTEDPLDFKGNVGRYAAIKDLSGNRAYTDEEALAFAEIDYIRYTESYDGSNERITLSENSGKLSLGYDYVIPEGHYSITTSLPVSHLYVFINGATTFYDRLTLTDDDEGVTYDVREGMYLQGNDILFEKTGDIEKENGNYYPSPDVDNPEAYTVSRNTISLNKLD